MPKEILKSSAPHVKTTVYEGPLDLLLDLIEKRKLLINDISLATVTEEYIAKVNAMKDLPMGETAEFVSLAATLLLIKSRSLLPLLTLSDEESRDIQQLEYRLAVYQIIKNSARGLSAQFDTNTLYEGVPAPLEAMYVPDPAVTEHSMLSAARVLIDGFPKMLSLPKVAVQKVISLEEMIDRLAQRVSSAMKLSFKEFTGKHQKADVIVGFLALLELVKQGILQATQDKEFGDISLESSSVSTPSFE